MEINLKNQKHQTVGLRMNALIGTIPKAYNN